MEELDKNNLTHISNGGLLLESSNIKLPQNTACIQGDQNVIILNTDSGLDYLYPQQSSAASSISNVSKSATVAIRPDTIIKPLGNMVECANEKTENPQHTHHPSTIVHIKPPIENAALKYTRLDPAKASGDICAFSGSNPLSVNTTPGCIDLTNFKVYAMGMQYIPASKSTAPVEHPQKDVTMLYTTRKTVTNDLNCSLTIGKAVPCMGNELVSSQNNTVVKQANNKKLNSYRSRISAMENKIAQRKMHRFLNDLASQSAQGPKIRPTVANLIKYRQNMTQHDQLLAQTPLDLPQKCLVKDDMSESNMTKATEGVTVSMMNCTAIPTARAQASFLQPNCAVTKVNLQGAKPVPGKSIQPAKRWKFSTDRVRVTKREVTADKQRMRIEPEPPQVRKKSAKKIKHEAAFSILNVDPVKVKGKRSLKVKPNNFFSMSRKHINQLGGGTGEESTNDLPEDKTRTVRKSVKLADIIDSQCRKAKFLAMFGLVAKHSLNTACTETNEIRRRRQTKAPSRFSLYAM